MYKHYDSMDIDEDKLLYDLSDHVYIYVDVIIPNGKQKFKNKKVEEMKYYRVKDNQLIEKFIRQLEGRVGGGGQYGVGGGEVCPDQELC